MVTVTINRTNLKDVLNNILENLNANIEDFQANIEQKRDKKRIKKIIDKIDSEQKHYIENKINADSRIKKLIDERLKIEENYFIFGENFKEFEPIGSTPKKEKKNRKNPSENVTTRKRKLLPITSERMLKELPSVYTEISTDQTKEIEAAKNVFDKITKQVPPTPEKRFKFIATRRIILQLTKNECR